MDGLVHVGYASNMSDHLINLNLFEYFRGGESVYYFMPGLRYILSIINLFFGDTFNGVLLILIFFPVIIYFVLLKLNITKKYALIVTISFIFLKIPYVGFSFNHFLRSGLTIYPETFAAFLFFAFLILLFKKNIFLSGVICSLMIFIRPNYLPILMITMVFHFIIYFKSKNFKNFTYGLLGLSLVLLIPVHNLIFGGDQFAFLTSSAFISSNLKVDPYEYFLFFSDYEIKTKIINHIFDLITTGERNNLFAYIINFLLLINLIFFNIFMIKKLNHKIILISFFALSLQFFGLFYINTGRYAYFPWLLVLIANLLIFKDFYFKKIYYLFSKQ